MKSFIGKILLCAVCVGFLSSTVDAEWKKQRLTTLAWLHSVFFINENKGWIVGSKGTIIKTENGGESWQNAESPTKDTIRKIFFQDEETGWILCERNRFQLRGKSPNYLMKTDNGGQSWDKIEFSGGDGTENIVNFFFGKDLRGWSVGEKGSIFEMQSDRKTWKKQSLDIKYVLFDGAFNDYQNGCIVGAGGTVLFTEDEGKTWDSAVVTGDNGTRFNSIKFVNKKTGWIVGAGGKIYVTNNAGKNWNAQKTFVTSDLFDVFFVSEKEGWASGKDGTLLHTVNAGNNWVTITSNTKHQLEKLFFVNSRKGWAVGFGGTILKWTS